MQKWFSTVDSDQSDAYNRENVVRCPRCNTVLMEVKSLLGNGLTRHKCRKCKKYIRVRYWK